MIGYFVILHPLTKSINHLSYDAMKNQKFIIRLFLIYTLLKCYIHPLDYAY